jgi:hypothetical protein
MVSNKPAVGLGGGALLGGAVGALAWARGAMEAVSDAQLVLLLGAKVVTVLLLLGGAISVLWGLGAFDKVIVWLRPKPRRVSAMEVARRAEQMHDWKMDGGGLFEINKALRQGAVDRAITIYGRKMLTRYSPNTSDMYPLHAIPPEQFLDLIIVFPPELDEKNNHPVKACDIGPKDSPNYMDLHIGTAGLDRWLKHEAGAWKGSLMRAKAGATL